MLRLMNVDLTRALQALSAQRPSLNHRGFAMALHRLKRGDSRNYLFLSREDKSWLFALPEVYEEGTLANITWLAPSNGSHLRTDALLLQVRRAPRTRPRGNLTVLHYPDVALDVEVFSLLPCPADRETHLRAFLRICARDAEPCKWGDYLRHLKGDGPRGHGG